MPLKLMYITNKPAIAKIAEENSVDRVWVDLETMGKRQRQRNVNSVKSDHTMADVSAIRAALTTARLLVRVNPLHEGTKREVDEVIARGADIVMLPMFKTSDEARQFIDFVGGRAKTLLLAETIGAEQNLAGIAALDGVDEIHIGLNDLHLQHHMTFMFELLANGTVERMAEIIKLRGIPFGFGGIARLDEGLLPARHIIAEHYRLGSGMAILSRSFYDSWVEAEPEEIRSIFHYGMLEIREFEKRLSKRPPEYFAENQQRVAREVRDIVTMQKNKRS